MNDQERKEFEQNEQGFENQPAPFVDGSNAQPNEQGYFNQPEQPMVDVNAQAYANQGFFENQPAPQGNFGYQPNANGGFAPEMMGAPQQNGRGKFFGLGVTSMILGIISIVCCCCFGAPIILAITALVFAILRMSQKPDGFSIAGLVTSIIGLIFNALMLVALFSGEMDVTFGEFESMLESVEDVIKMFIVK